VDSERAIFSGGSVGGAMAWLNAAKLPCIGALPIIGYIPKNCRPSKKGLYYAMGGAWDYNRYSTATAAAKFGKRATHRIFLGGHAGGKAPWVQDGLLWIYTRHLYEREDEFEAERSRVEPSLLAFLKEMAETDSQRAFWLADHLLNTCRVSGTFQSQVEGVHSALEEDELNVKYLAGQKDLAQFSLRYLAPVGPGSRKGHTTEKIERAAKKLQQKYADVKEIAEVAEGLSRKTD